MDAIKVINLITAELDKLNQQPLDQFSGDTLSKIGVRLAAYKAGMGVHSTIARKEMWVAEKRLKEAKGRAYQELRANGKGDGEAKALSILWIGNEYDEFIAAQEVEDKITTLSYNVHDLIDAIKSRLINLQMEKQENGVR